MSRPSPLAPLRFRPSIEEPEAPAEVLWFVFRGRDLLLTDAHELPTKAQLDEKPLGPDRSLYLGELEGHHCYAAQLPEDRDPPTGLQFVNLMVAYFRMDEDIAQLAGHAVQIIEWDRTHGFCGACAAPTAPAQTERARRCATCGLMQFPRLSPAVIVAVERDDQLLLGRAPQFPSGIYSVLAGFVEPGESAEDAVVREVFEETGIEVEDVRYFGSQPWPFPNSLMLGYQARYAGGDVRVDGVEILAADWFRADAMPRYFEGNVSIAQWLINDFLRRSGEPG